MERIRQAFPTRALMLFLAIGIIDLISTAVLYSKGMITEVNPLMRFFIDRSDWLFVLVKALTLAAGWYALQRYARQNLDFVRKACTYASLAYVAIWVVLFVGHS